MTANDDDTTEPTPAPAPARPARRRPDPFEHVERLASAAMAVIVLDQLTGRHLAGAVQQLAARLRYTMTRRELELPPAMISALHTEARAITREAAPDA